MLIMITNQCFENCPHCMEDSNPNGQIMDARAFHKAIKFAQYIGCSSVILSGGEPTTHPDFFKFCKSLNDDYKMPFTIVSNGTWCDDEKIVRQVKRICSDFKYMIGMQVYTNKLFYKDYDKIHNNKAFFDSFDGKITLDESQIRSMQDLGRARTCEIAQKMCDESEYHMSCLNAALISKQVSYPTAYGKQLEMNAKHFCHPMVDFNGYVHLSESWLCPNVGNVTKDLFDKIWLNIQLYQPCGKCKGYKKFIESTNPRIMLARKIIEGDI